LYGDAQIHYLEYAEGTIRRQEFEAALDVLDMVLALSPDNDELSEKYVEIAMRGDQPERGGKELIRRGDRPGQAGRPGRGQEVRDRASRLAPSLGSLAATAGENGAAPAAPAGAAEPETSASGYELAAPPEAGAPAGTPDLGHAGPIEPGVVSFDAPPAPV